MSPLLLYLLLFALTVAACFTFYRALWHPGISVADRLSSEAETKRRLSGNLSFALQQAIGRWPAKQSIASPAEQKLSSTLSYAGFRSIQAVMLFQLTRGALMIFLTLFGVSMAAAFHKSILGAGAIGCLLGYILPTLIIRRLASARQRRIKAELPDILALLVVSLEAGVGFSEAVKLVGREAERQGRLLGQELSTTAAHMGAGRSLADSLKDLGERNGVEELKTMAALAIQSDKAGAQIAPALRASAELLTSQRRLAAEEAAHKTAVKMLVPLVFLILPAMLLIVLGPAMIQMLRMFNSVKQ
jgi:tight adherence protein C